MKKYDRADIYNEKFDANVDEILKKIDEIKAVIAGRDESFLPYIMAGDRVDKICLDNLIYELISYIEERDKEYDLDFSEEKKDFFYNYFYCSIFYCVVVCHENDSIFESILKLAKITLKESVQDESAFDILITDMLDDYLEEAKSYKIKEHYIKFNNRFEELYEKKYFEPDIRYSINTFLELRKISKYTREDNSEIIRILNQAKYRLKVR